MYHQPGTLTSVVHSLACTCSKHRGICGSLVGPRVQTPALSESDLVNLQAVTPLGNAESRLGELDYSPRQREDRLAAELRELDFK